jgi:hypothetical protein
VAKLIFKHSPDTYAGLFKNSQCINLWFDHFDSSASLSYGAKALASYSLKHREKVCMLTCWGACLMSCSIKAERKSFADMPLSDGSDLQVWDMLAWTDAHGHTPVTVVARPNTFSRLDVMRTVLSFARDCPDFWASTEFKDSLAGGHIIALDPDYFVEVQVPATLSWMPYVISAISIFGIANFHG